MGPITFTRYCAISAGIGVKMCWPCTTPNHIGKVSTDFGRRAFDKILWQSSPAGVSPGLLALDLACASPRAPHPRRVALPMSTRRGPLRGMRADTVEANVVPGDRQPGGADRRGRRHQPA